MTSSETTTCCIAGCGPAGAVLGLLLARAGVDVLVLEKHADFFRDFRGDTIHPSTLQIIEELGFMERFSQVPQHRMSVVRVVTDTGSAAVVDLRGQGLRHPYIAFVPQWDFLDFLTDEARRYGSFELRMEAEVIEAVRSNGRVAGVRYRGPDGVHEVHCDLTVAADGRDSVLRKDVGLVAKEFGAPMDVLWFRVSRHDSDPKGSFGRITSGRFAPMIDRGTYWQTGYVVPKGSDAELRAGGIEVLRDSLARLMPFLADRVGELESWDDVRTLEVQVNRLRRWHLPGLLCIGDAAHAMSPIAGIGINLAIQDAVATANGLAEPLRRGTLQEPDLARVQRRRWLPTVVTQTVQRLIQRVLIRPVLAGQPFRPPRALRYLARVRALRRLPALFIGVGVLPEHVRVREVWSARVPASQAAPPRP